MKPRVLSTLSSEVAYGLHELLRTDAANIHQSNDWFILFSLLEVVGAAAHPPPMFQPVTHHLPANKPLHHSQSIPHAESDTECSDCVTTSSTDKGYTSDSEVGCTRAYPKTAPLFSFRSIVGQTMSLSRIAT